MPLANLYGLSETSAAATHQDFPHISLNRAGSVLPGTEIKIFNQDEKGIGEICIRGRHVFMGYLKNSHATQDVLDAEGFFHTGDLG